ncbi:MAG: hypothetical protein P4M06_08430, partial [Pandoraea sp.]
MTPDAPDAPSHASSATATPTGSAATHAPPADRAPVSAHANDVYVARLGALRANLPVSLSGSFLTVWLIVAVLREVFPLSHLLVWAAAQAALTLWRATALITYPGLSRKHVGRTVRADTRDIDMAALRRWDWRVRAGSLAAGLLWGIP